MTGAGPAAEEPDPRTRSQIASTLYLKPDWDHLFSFRGWSTGRHDVRNVYESLLATLFVRSLLANWRKNDRRAPAWYVLLSPLVIVVVAFPIVAVGIWMINYAAVYLWHAVFAHRVVRNPVHMPHALDWLGTYLAGYPWQPVLIGILAGLVVHRVYARRNAESGRTAPPGGSRRPGIRRRGLLMPDHVEL